MLKQDTVHEMNCFEAMAKIPDESVDLVLTDPPYPNGMKLFQDLILDGYAALYYSCKKLKKDGLLAFFWNANDVPPPPRGWYEVARHIWHKPDARTRLNNYECIIVWSKNYQRLPSRMFSIPLVDARSIKDWHPHPTQKPVRLLRYMLDMYSKPGDIVLDPFVGSGSTAIACKQTKRHFYAVEINPGYAKIAQERLAATKSFEPETVKELVAEENATEPILPNGELTAETEPAPYRRELRPLTRPRYTKAADKTKAA